MESSKWPGLELYLHVPFCRSKCLYCDFASWADKDALMPAYVEAVCAEAMARAKEIGQRTVETAFLGGGTPSVLPPELLNRLLTGTLTLFPLASGGEFTTEANPGALTEAWLEVALRHGVNRLSTGMQAYQPQLLHTLGRIHTFAQVEQSVALSRRCGLDNISLDLMFGLPGQTCAMWLETLEAALSLHPRHLSCYGLIPEEGTPLFAMLSDGRLRLPEEEAERQMYDDCIRLLARHGYVQYEISNFALPGYACRHNLGYWRQIPYLGLGASAASMLTTGEDIAYCRETNPPALTDYLHMVEKRAWQARETEPISPKEARFETMMLGLRTTEGVSEAEFARMHGVTLAACYGKQLHSLEERGLVALHQGRWALTRRGMDIQNSVLVELMA